MKWDKSAVQRRSVSLSLYLCEETILARLSQKSSESREEWCGVEVELLRSPNVALPSRGRVPA